MSTTKALLVLTSFALELEPAGKLFSTKCCVISHILYFIRHYKDGIRVYKIESNNTVKLTDLHFLNSNKYITGLQV